MSLQIYYGDYNAALGAMKVQQNFIQIRSVGGI